MTTPRIHPTLTPKTERYAADQAIERTLAGIAEREAIADVATAAQLDTDAQLRVGLAVAIGMQARRAKASTPVSLVAGELIAGAIALAGRAVEMCRCAEIFDAEQVLIADAAGIELQRLLLAVVDAASEGATIPPGVAALETVFRARGELAAGIESGRVWMRMIGTLTRKNRVQNDVEDLEAAFGNKAGR